MKKIAVVEDNEDNLLLVEAILEDHYELAGYGDGISALEGMVADPPDLVLLDISLPGIDGTETLSRLRRIDHLAGIPVVALTAHAMAGDAERFLRSGFDAYVAKPIVDDAALVAEIERLLSAGRP